MAERLTKLVEDLKTAYGPNLAAVVLYGAGAVDGAAPQGGLNTLVMLNRITPTDLRLAQPVIAEWRKAGHPLPLFFTVGELAHAADVFPVEFGDIVAVHRVVYGADPLGRCEIKPANLRHQLEYELRSRLLKLRELYIPNSADADRLTKLMADSLNSFALYFRHTLVLLGVPPPLAKGELIALTVSHLKLRREPFEAVLRAQEGERMIEADAHKVFADYLEELEKVIGAVDTYGG